VKQEKKGLVMFSRGLVKYNTFSKGIDGSGPSNDQEASTLNDKVIDSCPFTRDRPFAFPINIVANSGVNGISIASVLRDIVLQL
jgi:hypothetical protein